MPIMNSIKLVKVYSNICYQVALSNALFYNTSLFDYAVVVQCGTCEKRTIIDYYVSLNETWHSYLKYHCYA